MSDRRDDFPATRHIPGWLMAAAVALVTLSFDASARAALDEKIATHAPSVTAAKIAQRTIYVRTSGHLKEFADEHGRVFAAKWDAGVDVRALLGSHYDEFAAAFAKRVGRSHHIVIIDTPSLLVRDVRYPGQIEGVMVLKTSLPQGVSIDALR